LDLELGRAVRVGIALDQGVAVCEGNPKVPFKAEIAGSDEFESLIAGEALDGIDGMQIDLVDIMDEIADVVVRCPWQTFGESAVDETVGAGAAGHGVAAEATEHEVLAGVPGHKVVPRFAEQHVTAAPAGDEIVPTAASDSVVAALGGNGVGVDSTGDRVREIVVNDGSHCDTLSIKVDVFQVVAMTNEWIFAFK
jgi:hypothetical protein